jgi:hypothetical protein
VRRRFVDWFLRDRGTGRITFVQWPNPALWVWGGHVSRRRAGRRPLPGEEVHWIGAGALIAWGADEILPGVNPARRLLGLVVLDWQVYHLVS